VDANSSEALAALVDIAGLTIGQWRVCLLKNNQAVVAEILEVSAEEFKELLFLVLEEVLVLLNELSDNVIEEGEGIGQVHHVAVGLAAGTDDVLETGF